MRTTVIADIGSNHDGSFEKARYLINKAKEAGATAAKFQLFRAHLLYPENEKKQKSLKPYELPMEWIPRLKKTCDLLNIDFLCSPFDRNSLRSLEKVHMKMYKVASSEIVKKDLLRAISALNKPIVMSTGMSDLVDVYEAVQTIRQARPGTNMPLTLLQCVSSYPTEPSCVNLRVMDAYQATFDCPVGLSDHTPGIEIALAAVARGASIIEKHLTANRNSKGPDHFYALEPPEFKALIEGIKKVEAALGSPLKRMLPQELSSSRGERHGLKEARREKDKKP